MGDIDVLEAQELLLKQLLFSKEREYYYGLSSDDVQTICSYRLPKEANDEVKVSDHFSIKPLSEGNFGSAQMVTYKGKQYVRKVQPVTIVPEYAELLQLPSNYSPFLTEIDAMMKFSLDEEMKPYVPVYYGHKIIESDGIYLMELLRGDTLDNLCKNRGLTETEWNNVIGEIKKILDLLHKKDYVFNDIHGGNFFITMDGTKIDSVVLIDFGLTRPKDWDKHTIFEIKQAEYKLAKQKGAYAERPFPEPNIPAYNHHMYDIMLKILVEDFRCGKKAVNASFPAIEKKPRDFTLRTRLNTNEREETKALRDEIQEIHAKLQKLRTVLIRTAPTPAQIPLHSLRIAKKAMKELQKKPSRFSLKTLRQLTKGSKGGKRTNRKYRTTRKKRN